MMKKKSCPRTIVVLCETWSSDDGQSPADEARQSLRDRARKQRGGHRDWQYCKQARQALESALACDLCDADLPALEVIDVSPKKGCAVLSVTLGSEVQTVEALDDQYARLVLATGILRAAIAEATHRKRVASLRFELIPVVR